MRQRPLTSQSHAASRGNEAPLQERPQEPRTLPTWLTNSVLKLRLGFSAPPCTYRHKTLQQKGQPSLRPKGGRIGSGGAAAASSRFVLVGF